MSSITPFKPRAFIKRQIKKLRIGIKKEIEQESGKAGEKWAKITMRLHHKVCSKTGRTDEVKHLVHNRSGDSSLIQNASITGAPQVERETEGINNQLERTTTYKRLFFR